MFTKVEQKDLKYALLVTEGGVRGLQRLKNKKYQTTEKEGRNQKPGKRKKKGRFERKGAG